MVAVRKMRLLAAAFYFALVSCQQQTDSKNITGSDSDLLIENSIINSRSSNSELVTNSASSLDTKGETLNTNDYVGDQEDSGFNSRQCPQDVSKPCIVKCCPLGESIGADKVCEPADLKFQVQFFGEREMSNSTVHDDTFHFIYGNPCPFGKYRLEPRKDSNDEFHILRNGSIRAPYLFTYPLMPSDYCLEVFRDEDMFEEDVLPLICFREPAPDMPMASIQYILYPIGLLISVPFLLATMLVYCLIPDLRDLHGKSLSCHVVCLAIAYVFLAAVQLVGETMNQEICVGFAFMVHFSFVACFFWLNVLCIDTWWNVRAYERLRWGSSEPNDQFMYYTQTNGEILMKKETERKAFICYSIYAWCGPIFFVTISMTMDLMPTIPSSYLKPHFGESKCWFNSEEAELQYFYAPVGFLIAVNVILFISTAIRIFKHKWQRHETKRTPRQMFRMCVILFGVMGINWIMEVVSWALGGPDYIWYITDVINTLQGVIIFCIYVLEPRVRDHIRLQLWPKLSDVLCKCHSKPARGIVLYKSPEKATENMNSV